EVPDLEVAVATRVDGAADGLRPELRAAVVVELRARAGRAGTPGVPEVLLAGQPDDLALVDADAREGVERLGVLVPDGHPQAGAVEPVAALVLGGGEEVPGV